jgi:hypothetical protein
MKVRSAMTVIRPWLSIEASMFPWVKLGPLRRVSLIRRQHGQSLGSIDPRIRVLEHWRECRREAHHERLAEAP